MSVLKKLFSKEYKTTSSIIITSITVASVSTNNRFKGLQNENYNPVNIYLFKVNNRNIAKRYEICAKLTIKTPERHR